VRGVVFEPMRVTGEMVPVTNAGGNNARLALRDVASHLGFATVTGYCVALVTLERTILDRATRTKWIKEHANG